MKYKLSHGQIREVAKRASTALYDYCRNAKIHYVVTGSSGGLDSAVTLGLAERACQLAAASSYRLTSVGLILPCHSKPDAERLGRQAVEKFHAKEIRIDLSQAYEYLSEKYFAGTNAAVRKIISETGGESELSEWGWSEKIASGNIKSRLRMLCGTYHVARMLKGIVLSTDNLSEYWMAFWTLHGDVGDFGMIQNIMKGLEMYDIARFLGVPEEIIAARPDDGLGIASGDEDQLGASYPLLDSIMIRLTQAGFSPDGSLEQLRNLPELAGIDKEVARKLASRAICGSYKRIGARNLSRKELGLLEIAEIGTQERVVLYGGSFNPPGLHHCRIARELLNYFDRVIIVPCGYRGDKPSANIVELKHRAEMSKMAFAGLPVELDLHDLERGVFTPTHKLQNRYENKFPDAEIWHAVGSDIVAGGAKGESQIHKIWQRGKMVWQIFQFAVTNRPDCVLNDNDLPPRSQIIEIPGLYGSGTMIRELIAKGEPTKGLLLPEIAEYIAKNSLYKDGS